VTPLNGAAVLDQVRSALDEAHAAGLPRPGRPTLAQITGATEHQVRLALAVLKEEHASLGATVGSQSSADQSAATADSIPQPTLASAGDAFTSVTPESAPRRPPSWPLVIIGLAAAISVWSGWVGLGQLAGFGLMQPLPGVWDDLRINSAVVLPISVEAYAAYALRCWLTTQPITHRARTFARRSTITSLVIGAAAQIAFHLMAAAGLDHAPWPVTVGVATIPVLVLGLATALASLIGATRKDES
jgi:hypothetical protein